MFFLFNNQSKIKNVEGRFKSIFMSLQLKKPATIINSNVVSKRQIIISPKLRDFFVAHLRWVKRTFLSTSLKGSITIEASIVLPIFIFAMISIIYFFNLIYIQLTMQIQLENVSKLINASTCVTTAANIQLTDEESSALKKITFDIAGNIAVRALFLTDEMKEFVDNTLIVNGSDGLIFLGENIADTSYPLELKLSYGVRMPFIPSDIFTIQLHNCCYFKAFNGKQLKNNIDLREIYVYVAENSDVFHASKVCSHLARFTELVNINTLKQKHPNITSCSFCSKNTNLISTPGNTTVSYVYVTSEYDVYHILEACPYLQRHIIRLTYHDADMLYAPCSRCVVYTE